LRRRGGNWKKAEPSLRAAALLRIARAQSTSNGIEARRSLVESLKIIF
jgi:hypothetical protein